MNTIGKIKTGILVLAFVVNIIFPSPPDNDQGSFWLIVPVVFIIGAFVLPLLLKVNAWAAYTEIFNPGWNDHPLSRKRPLVFFHFIANMVIATGIGLIIGTSLKYHKLNESGLVPMAFGIGILAGIRLTLLWIPDNRGKN